MQTKYVDGISITTRGAISNSVSISRLTSAAMQRIETTTNHSSNMTNY